MSPAALSSKGNILSAMTPCPFPDPEAGPGILILCRQGSGGRSRRQKPVWDWLNRLITRNINANAG